MITGELRSKVDSLWEIFWTGGLTNPLDVVEQMTYLMFIRDLDDSDNLHAKEAAMLGLSIYFHRQCTYTGTVEHNSTVPVIFLSYIEQNILIFG